MAIKIKNYNDNMNNYYSHPHNVYRYPLLSYRCSLAIHLFIIYDNDENKK